jgi:hypothetical protein
MTGGEIATWLIVGAMSGACLVAAALLVAETFRPWWESGSDGLTAWQRRRVARSWVRDAGRAPIRSPEDTRRLDAWKERVHP